MAGLDGGLWRGMLTGGAALFVPEALFAQTAEPETTLEATYTLDLLANLDGGNRSGAQAMGLFDLVADADGAAIGADDLSFHLDLQIAHGGGFSDSDVGDAQVVSNIDAPDGIRPLEAWVGLGFGGGAGKIKAGLIDLNGDFDVQDTGALFINSSHGIGSDFSQTGRNGPSIFPTSASAVTLTWQAKGWSVRAGLFDAVAGDPARPRRTVVRFPGESGLLMVGEVDFALGDAASVQFGGWAYTSRFDPIDGESSPRRDNRGIYGLIDGTLARRGESALDAWVRVGTAKSALNPIAVYVGGGIAWGDDASRLGLAIGQARLGDPAIRAGIAAGTRPDRAETVFELTWAVQVDARMIVQPDMQYVINPAWDRAKRNALVGGVRVQFALF